VILVVYGTTGELIKLAPVIRRLRDRGDAPLIATTAQQVTQIPQFIADLDVPEPDWWLARGAGGRDLEHRGDIPGWLVRCATYTARHRRDIRERLAAGPDRSLVLVHGDTMTTVLGALAGRMLRLPVGHVEAGLRSGSLREPFPEELDRRVTSWLATVHFAPGAWAKRNLERARVRGTIVDTGGNTVGDAIRDRPPGQPNLPLPDERFGVVSLHREELLQDERRFRETLEALVRGSRETPLLFVDHSVTVAAVRRLRLEHLFDGRLRRVPRQPHGSFLGLLRQAAFLVTDSGGSQEECAALGIPCLIHRRRTERLDGLEEGIVSLTGLEVAPIERFLRDHRATGYQPAAAPERAPSDVIVDWLAGAGFLRSSAALPKGLATFPR
jgi:UDP-N-acetylglucosamine 2-epimerase (non-hydrolysing)